MRKAIIAGISYFAIVFAAGFALGVVRTLWLAPTLGAPAAVATELPFMLAASWFAAIFVAQKLNIGADLRARLIMGEAAFALLMSAEFALAYFAFGRSPLQQIAEWRTLEGVIGLAGQIAFAAFPALQAVIMRKR